MLAVLRRERAGARSGPGAIVRLRGHRNAPSRAAKGGRFGATVLHSAGPVCSVRRHLPDHDPATDAVRRRLAPFDFAAELLDALAHAAQPEAVRPASWVAADAVVA